MFKLIVILCLFVATANARSWRMEEASGSISSQIREFKNLEASIYFLCYRRAIVDIGLSDVEYCGEGERFFDVQTNGSFQVPEQIVRRGNYHRSKLQFRLYQKGLRGRKLLNAVNLDYSNRMIQRTLKQLYLYSLPRFKLPLGLRSGNPIDRWLRTDGRETEVELSFYYKNSTGVVEQIGIRNIGNIQNNPREFEKHYFVALETLDLSSFDLKVKVSHPYFGTLLIKNFSNMSLPLTGLDLEIEDTYFNSLDRDITNVYSMTTVDYTKNLQDLSQLHRQMLLGSVGLRCKMGQLTGEFTIHRIAGLMVFGSIAPIAISGNCRGESVEATMELPTLEDGQITGWQRVSLKTNEVRYLSQFSKALVIRDQSHSSFYDEVPVKDASGNLFAWIRIKN